MLDISRVSSEEINFCSLLVGDGARLWAEEVGIPITDPKSLVSGSSRFSLFRNFTIFQVLTLFVLFVDRKSKEDIQPLQKKAG